MTNAPSNLAAAIPAEAPDAIAQTVSGLFSTLADAMPQMVWATDADGAHFYFNRCWYEYTGLSETESMGFGFATVLHPGDTERTLAAWRSAWERGADYEIEYRFRRKDGAYRWFVGRATPVRDAATGAVTLWVGTCTDIDDAHQVLDSLRESKSRLSVAADAARLGMWQFDLAAGTMSGSARTRELFGVGEDRAYTLVEWGAIIHEEDRARVSALFTDYIAAASGDPQARYLVQYRVRRADHTVRYLSVMGVPVVENGVAVRIVGAVQDSTEQHNTLASLRESADALRESEVGLRGVLGNAPLIVFAIDRNGVFTFSDGKILSTLGLAPGEAVGKTAEELYGDNPELMAYIHRALAGETVFWTSTVNDIAFETQCTPVYDDDGDGGVDGIIGVSYDVSERNRASETLRVSEAQYRFLFDTVASGVVYQDGNARILDANPAAERILGLTLAQMQGRDSFDPRWRTIREDGSDFPDDDHPVPVALRTGQAVRGVPMGVFHPAENRYRWLSVSAVPLFHAGETKPHLVYAYFEDQTEWRAAETALRASEERFRLATSNARLGVWEFGGWLNRFAEWFGTESPVEMRYDATFAQIFEVTPTGATVAQVLGRLHPDDSARATANAGDAIARGAYYADEYRLLLPNGAERWVRATGQLFADAAGLGRFVGTAQDVTALHEAEQRLRASETRYRTLTEVLPQSIWAADPSGGLTYCNRYWYDYTGLSEAQTLGAGWVSVMHRDDVPRVSADWQAALDTGNNYETEARLRRASDGAYRSFLIRGRATRDADTGAITNWLGTAIDIHDRQAAEQSLREEEARFRDLADNIAQLAWMTDATGYIFWYNQRWYDYTGTTLEEMQGWGWQKVHHPDFVEPVTARFADYVARGAAWEDTFPLRGADGAYRWFLSRAFPIRNEGGEIVRWFGTNTDITGEREASAAVRRSEERFRSLVTATAQIVWSTDAAGEFVAEQEPWARFTGQTRAEYAGMGWMEAVHPDDHEETVRIWDGAVRDQAPLYTEHRLRGADGAYRYMSVRAVSILETDGTVREWIGVHSDITEQKEAEYALAEYALQQAHVAEVLQRSLLSTPPGDAFPGVTVSTHYESALDEAQVGGDFFDVFALDGGRVAFVVGDVTGKGLKAAEHTGQLKYALRAFLRENPDPGDALPRVNRLLTDAQRLDPANKNGDQNAMAAVTVAVMDAATGTVRIAGGGAESPLLYRAASGMCEEIETLGMVVGGYAGSAYTVAERTLAPGDLLLIGTDGITESRRSRREFFGTDGFAHAAEGAAARTNDPEAVSMEVIAAAKAFSASGTFRDDVCLLVARRD